MPWKQGQSGNPYGRLPSEQAYTNCLRAALNATDPKKKRRYLQLGAEKVAHAFAEGEPWAVTHVADRLDGKPHQTSDVNVRKGNLNEWTDEEIIARLSEIGPDRGAGASPDALDETPGEGKPH